MDASELPRDGLAASSVYVRVGMGMGMVVDVREKCFGCGVLRSCVFGA